MLRALTPLLETNDAPAVARLLAPTEWSKESFYVRLLWLTGVPNTVLTPEVRDTLILVAETHKNPPVREWAIQALGRFLDPRAEQVLQQAEARGSQTAMHILCDRDLDPGAAFLRRFTNPNSAVREAAYGLVQVQFFGSSVDKVPGGLDPDRRAVILTHLLADWPATDGAPECVEAAMQRLYMLVVDAPLTQPARWSHELAAAVSQRADQVLSTKSGQQHAQRLLTALHWAHTPEARKSIDQLAQDGTNANLREAAKKMLQDWKTP